MLKRYFLLMIMAVAGTAFAMADIVIGGTSYRVDTVEMRQVGPGMRLIIARIPDYPLNVYLLSTDLNNPHNRIETTFGYGTLGRTERLDNAWSRNRTAISRPVAACNANFWTVGGSGEPYNAFELGSPMGAVVRNDSVVLNSEMNSDNWNGGPQRAGACLVDRDKHLVFGRFLCGGTISGDKLATPLDFCTVNRRNLPDAITLWNVAYSRTREFETDWVDFNERGANDADNYYLTLNDDSRWAVNNDMTFTVAKIVTGKDRQTLGDYDACLTVTGNKKEAMAALSEGDVITINHGWTATDAGNIRPDITNMVEGNAPVMIHGEYTTRNDDENYNSMVYSRTAYGTNAAGDRLYFIVIDKSISPTLGRSAGCNTRHMLDILSAFYPDVTDVINMDAGGSAQMMLNGAIINTTTEGNPRAVACGWQVCATGEVDNEIVSIAFYDWKLQAPVFSSLKPRIVAFNAAGEIVDNDLQGFTLECDKALGRTDGDTFIAGAAITTLPLTAVYNGLTATVNLTTIEAQPAIAGKPLIVVDNREWTVPVTATVNDETFTYNSALLEWDSDDPDVATIDHGTLRGVKNGSTDIHCVIGQLTDTATVVVEIANSEWLSLDIDDWTIRSAGFKDITFADNGTLTFTYSSNRSPHLNMSSEARFYGCPDTIAFVFNSTLPLQQVRLDLRNNLFPTQNYISFTGDDDAGFLADTEYTLKVALDNLGGAANLLSFPLYFTTLRLDPVKSDYGVHSLAFTIKAHYPAVIGPLPGDVNLDGAVNAGDISVIYAVILGTEAEPGNISRADVNGDTDVNAADVSAVYYFIQQ